MDLDSHIERILWTEDEISHRVHELATQISIDFSETPDNPDSSSSSAASVPAVVGVATGAFLFLADLVRKIKLPITVDLIRVESYGSGTVSSGKPKISCDLKIDVRDRHVILVSGLLPIFTVLCCPLIIEYLFFLFLFIRLLILTKLPVYARSTKFSLLHILEKPFVAFLLKFVFLTLLRKTNKEFYEE